MIEEDSKKANRRTIYLFATAAAMFLILAVVGGFITSRHMNATTDQHAMSAGRPGDERPNLIQEQQTDMSARGPSTTGSAFRASSVPPAH